MHVVVGVMPESFDFPYYQTQSSVASMPSGGRTEVWVPLDAAASGGGRAAPARTRLTVIARLEPPMALIRLARSWP